LKTKHEESPIIACLDGSSNLPGSTALFPKIKFILGNIFS